MGQIANYQDWIRRSEYDWRHPRSADLKNLDKKVEFYFANWKGANHERARNECVVAFYDYVKAKWKENPKYKPVEGMGITLSIWHPRNTTGAFDDLINTIRANNYTVSSCLTEAQSIVLDAQHNMLDRLFYTSADVPLQFTLKSKVSIKEKFVRGVKDVAVTVQKPFTDRTFGTGGLNNYNNPGAKGGNPSITGGLGKDKTSLGYNAVRGGLSTHEAIGHIEHGVQSPAEVAAHTTQELVPYLGHDIAGFVGTAVGEVVPIVGHILAAGKLIKAAVDVAMIHSSQYNLENISAMGYTAPGTPQAALNAVVAMYAKVAMQADVDLGIATVKFGTQFDPTRISTSIASASAAAAKIATLIATMIMEYKEVKAGNSIIVNKEYRGNFEKMFMACPLLGAYVIIGSDYSSIVNVTVRTYGQSGWNVNVEQMRRSTEEMFAIARTLIGKSKYEIQGFPKTAMPAASIPSTCVSKGIRGDYSGMGGGPR